MCWQDDKVSADRVLFILRYFAQSYILSTLVFICVHSIPRSQDNFGDTGVPIVLKGKSPT